MGYCQGQPQPSAAVQDRLIQVAGIVRNELERSGRSMALVARSGLALQRLGQRYQNCNQWLIELMASAWGALAPGADPRGQAQQWLRAQGYAPSTLAVGSKPLMALAALLPWLHNDDHPQEDLAESQFRVSMPESIAAFVHARLPDATRLELCYTTAHVVIHQGWEPMAQGCEPGLGDTVSPLLAGPG